MRTRRIPVAPSTPAARALPRALPLLLCLLALLSALLLAGCRTPQAPAEPTAAPTVAVTQASATPAATLVPTLTPTAAPTEPTTAEPTEAPATAPAATPPSTAEAERPSPDGLGTPVASGGPLAPENAEQVYELARWGKGAVASLAGSPDGSTVAVGTALGLYLYDAVSGQQRSFTPSDSPLQQVVYSGAEDVLLGLLEDHSLARWDANSGALLGTMPLDVPSQATGLQLLSPDGALLAQALRPNGIQLLNTADGSPTLRLQGHALPVERLVWSPDGTLLASTAGDGTTCLWRAADGEQLLTVGHEGTGPVAISPDGSLLALVTGEDGQRIDILESATGAVQQTLAAPEGSLQLAFDEDGQSLLALGTSGPLTRWQLAEGAAAPAEDQLVYRQLAALPAGGYAALRADGAILLQTSADEAPVTIEGHLPPILSLAANPEVGLLAMAAEQAPPRMLYLYDGSPAAQPAPGALEALYLRFAAGGATLVGASDLLGLTLWNAPDGSLAGSTPVDPDSWLVGTAGLWRFVAVSEVGDLLGVSPRGGGSYLFSALDGSLLQTLPDTNPSGREAGPLPMAFSPDGRLVVRGSHSDEILIFATGDGSTVAMLNGPGEGVYALAWSPDGALLATGGQEGLVIWSSEDWQPLAQQPDWTGSCSRLAFSPDGSVLVTSAYEGELSFWRTADWSLIGGMEPMLLDGEGLAFNADGTLLATASQAGLQLWDPAEGRLLSTLPGHAGAVSGLAFMEGGTQLVSAGLDGTIRVWGLAP
ncbi:MAG: WD40 repeat domain-containing protein [Anaerolineae bacterium]|jgi:WD40 repeat protein|nr:hypothetical protein [Chloroflexota bacterium]